MLVVSLGVSSWSPNISADISQFSEMSGYFFKEFWLSVTTVISVV